MDFHISSARFDPDGTRILTDLTDGSLQLWDPNTGRSLGRLKGQKVTMVLGYILAFHPIDERIAAVQMGSGVLRIWNPVTDVILSSGKPDAEPDGTVKSLAFDPTGKHLAAGYSEGLLRIWNLDEKKSVHRARVRGRKYERSVYGVAFSADGDSLFVSDGGRRVRQLDVESGAWTWVSEQLAGEYIDDLTVHPCGCALVRTEPDTVHLLHAITGLRTMTLLCPACVSGRVHGPESGRDHPVDEHAGWNGPADRRAPSLYRQSLRSVFGAG